MPLVILRVQNLLILAPGQGPITSFFISPRVSWTVDVGSTTSSVSSNSNDCHLIYTIDFLQPPMKATLTATWHGNLAYKHHITIKIQIDKHRTTIEHLQAPVKQHWQLHGMKFYNIHTHNQHRTIKIQIDKHITTIELLQAPVKATLTVLYDMKIYNINT